MAGGIEAARRRRDEEQKTQLMETQSSSATSTTSTTTASSLQDEGGPPMDPIKRYFQAIIILAVSLYGLLESKCVENLLWSKKINRPALAVAVVASSLVVLLWGYLDYYVGMIQGQKVNYTDARRITHVILLSIFVTGIALNVALWPVYHLASLVLVAMLSYGVLFQFLIVFPSYVYNPVFFALYAGFVFLWTR